VSTIADVPRRPIGTAYQAARMFRGGRFLARREIPLAKCELSDREEFPSPIDQQRRDVDAAWSRDGTSIAPHLVVAGDQAASEARRRSAES